MQHYSCNLFSHNADFDKIINETKKTFPTAIFEYGLKNEFKIISLTIKSGFLKKDKKLNISYRERLNLSYTLEKNEGPLTSNLMAIKALVESFPSDNRVVKSLLIDKIKTINCEFSIQMVQNSIPEFQQLVKWLAKAMEAIVMVESQIIVSKSDSVHFLDENLDLIIDSKGHNEISELEVKIEQKYLDPIKKVDLPEPEKRKLHSELKLKQYNIKINKELIFDGLNQNTKIRGVTEIAERIVSLALTNLVAFNNISGEQAIKYASKNNLFNFLSPNEIEFLNDPSEKRRQQETWKCESIWVLMWAIKVVEELKMPNEMADLSKIPSSNYPIGSGLDPNMFIRTISTTRTKSEILDAADLYYRMNWAVIDAKANSETIDSINPGIVYERLYTLYWLINHGNALWDDVADQF